MEQNQKSNSVVDALKRLERAGSENSRSTEKLREAARVVAGQVTLAVIAGDNENVMLPRLYQVIVNDNNQYVLFKMRPATDEDRWDEYCTDEYKRVETVEYHFAPRAAVLNFAADIADGLLDEIAAFLEERSQANEQAAQVLEAAQTQ